MFVDSRFGTISRRVFLYGLIVGVILAACLARPWPLFCSEDGQDRALPPKVVEAIDILRYFFFPHDVDVRNLEAIYRKSGDIKEMVASLNDPYTRYLDPAAFKTLNEDLSGTFEGIGATIGLRDNNLAIIWPIPGTPAHKAGLLPGDLILKIDGKSTKDMLPDYAASIIRGKKGTQVRLTVKRGSEEPFDVTIVRDTITVKYVSSGLLEDGIGYIYLSAFMGGQDTMRDLDKSMEDLLARGMEGLILDLRYNTGGALDLAIDVASRFLEPGLPVVHVIDRHKRSISYTSRENAPHYRLPIVLLVNETSASASEIVCGALKDMGVATVVGTKTFGKGLVQQIFGLSDGSGLSVTIAEYLTAGGKSINGKGIEPDVTVKLPEETPEEQLARGEALASGKTSMIRDAQLTAAIKILKEKIASTRKSLRKAG